MGTLRKRLRISTKERQISTIEELMLYSAMSLVTLQILRELSMLDRSGGEALSLLLGPQVFIQARLL